MDICILWLHTDLDGSAIFLSLGRMQPQDDIECWRITVENDVECELRCHRDPFSQCGACSSLCNRDERQGCERDLWGATHALIFSTSGLWELNASAAQMHNLLFIYITGMLRKPDLFSTLTSNVSVLNCLFLAFKDKKVGARVIWHIVFLPFLGFWCYE